MHVYFLFFLLKKIIPYPEYYHKLRNERDVLFKSNILYNVYSSIMQYVEIISLKVEIMDKPYCIINKSRIAMTNCVLSFNM